MATSVPAADLPAADLPAVDLPAGERPAGRRADIELMRVVAIVMIVSAHATAGLLKVGAAGVNAGLTSWLALVVNEASKAGLPVFVGITGWALLRRDTAGDDAWLGRRMARIVAPLLTWSAIYIGVSIIVGAVTGAPPWAPGEPWSWLGDQAVLVLTGPGPRSHLWYLYYAMALTLAIWLIRSAGVPIRGSRVLYAAAALALVLPLGIAAALDRTVSWRLFGWAIGYAALGVLLLESPPHRRLGAALYGSAVAALVVLVFAMGEQTWPTAFTSPLRVVAALGMVWMLVGLRMTPGIRFAAVRLGGLTFGVYLVHPLLLQLVRLVGRPGWPLELLPAWAHLGLMLLVAIVGSFALVALWHRSALLTRWLG